MIHSPLTVLALAISPIVMVTFVLQSWFKRDPLSQPSIVAAIPLGLSSIAILLGQSGVILLATFQAIATQQTAGMKAVVSGLIGAQQPLIWGLLDFLACLVVIFFVSTVLRYQRDEETPLVHAYVALPALIATAVVLVGLFLLVYFQYSTVDLVMKIVDNARYQELASQYGTANPAFFARTISSRLVIITFSSVPMLLILIASGILNLLWRQKQLSRQALAMVLTLGTLIGCGVSVLSELSFVDYLRHVR
ncbi:MAG TPA: hypothetical protein VKB38_17310 [Terracidiphilus sp.]|nr:hypothetical protein [Terracidiphilus sp.]